MFKSTFDKRIKVFGGTGFIGKHFLKSFPNTLAVSLRDTIEFKKDSADIFVNFIGKAHDHSGKATEEEYYHANFELVKVIYNEFISSDAKLFIHLSSIAAVEEFGSSDPLIENSKSNPVSFYGKSKRKAEEWLMQQSLPSDKKIIIIRPPMVHGMGDKGNLGLLYTFVSKGVPMPLNIFENKRTFIYIENFMFFMNKILNEFDKLSSGIYHISDDESISTKEIIKMMSDLCGKKLLNLWCPLFIIRIIGCLGDIIPIPIDSKKLKKLTSNLIISNNNIKKVLNINKLPFTAREGLVKTLSSLEI